MSGHSGHTTMTVRTQKLYQQVILNDQRRIMEHEAGLGRKPTRNNPILCTRSPRDKQNMKDFDFTPPPVSEVDKYTKKGYKYPEEDIGLMAQLPSQKEKFQKFRQKELEYKNYIEHHSNKNQSVDGSSSSSQQTTRNQNSNINNTSRSTSGNTGRLPQTKEEELDSYDYDNYNSSRLSTNRSMNTASAVGTGRRNGSNDNKKEIYKQNISDFKNLTLNNQTNVKPEMLKMYRAKRAAEFIDKQNPKYQTPVIYEDGSSVSHSHTHRATNISSSSNSGAEPDMTSLLNELKATEDKIQSLKLKVGLTAKTKSYERPTTHTSARRRPSI